MDIIGLCIFGTLAILIVAFIGYFITTKKIIDSQETEIEILKRDNERLKSALSGAKYVKSLTLSDTPISSGYHKAIIEPAKDLFREF